MVKIWPEMVVKWLFMSQFYFETEYSTTNILLNKSNKPIENTTYFYQMCFQWLLSMAVKILLTATAINLNWNEL